MPGPATQRRLCYPMQQLRACGRPRLRLQINQLHREKEKRKGEGDGESVCACLSVCGNQFAIHNTRMQQIQQIITRQVRRVRTSFLLTN